MNVQRPWSAGFGWIIAVLVLIIGVLSLVLPALAGSPHLLTWLLIALAAAYVIG